MRIAAEREVLVLEDNPYGLLRYEGEALPPLYALDGGVYVMYLGTFSKILSPGIRLGWVCAPPPVLEKINVGKQGADLCTSTLSQLMVQAYFEHADWRQYVRFADRGLPAPPRRHAGRPRGVLPRPGRVDPPAGRHVRVGHAAGLHRHHRPAGPRAARQRGVRAGRRRLPGRPRRRLDAPELLRLRRGAHREGIRRIGKVISEQMDLYGTLTGEMQAVSTEELEIARQAEDTERGAECRAQRSGAGGPPANEPRRGPEGRALAGAPGVAPIGRQRGGRAGPPGPRGRLGGRGQRPDPAAARGTSRRGLRGAPRPRRRGRNGAGTAGDPGYSVHRLGRAGVLAGDRQGHDQAPPPGRGDPYAGLRRLHPDRLPRAGRRGHPGGHRGAAGVPHRGQALAPGVGPGDQVRRAPRTTCPVRWWPRSPTTSASCSSATWRAATWPYPCSRDPMGPRRCPSSRPCRATATRTTTSRATTSAARSSCARPSWGPSRPSGPTSSRSAPTGCSVATGSRAWT